MTTSSKYTQNLSMSRLPDCYHRGPSHHHRQLGFSQWRDGSPFSLSQQQPGGGFKWKPEAVILLRAPPGLPSSLGVGVGAKCFPGPASPRVVRLPSVILVLSPLLLPSSCQTPMYPTCQACSCPRAFVLAGLCFLQQFSLFYFHVFPQR